MAKPEPEIKMCVCDKWERKCEWSQNITDRMKFWSDRAPRYFDSQLKKGKRITTGPPSSMCTRMAPLVTRVRRPAWLRDAGKTAGASQNCVIGRKQNLLLVSAYIWNIIVHLQLPLLCICVCVFCVCLNNRPSVLFGVCTDWQDIKQVRDNSRWARLKFCKGAVPLRGWGGGDA